MQLTDFEALSFDCYGTLIDWETGIYAALQGLRGRAGVPDDRDRVLEAFARHESRQQAETPSMLYPDLLATVYGALADEWGVAVNDDAARAFGRSVPDWPAFADSAAALAYLKQHYRLIILSNVDRASFQRSNAKLGVAFDAVYTAQDIGCYKPNPEAFRYLIRRVAEDLGIANERILHTAQSLFHDHLPAVRLGLATNWIDRRGDRAGHGATMAPAEPVQVDFHFPSLADFALHHRAISENSPGIVT